MFQYKRNDMTTILLSIKSNFVEKILAREKLFEFRKRVPDRHVDKIIIYSSSPVCAVVGEAEVAEILSDTPINIWNTTKNQSGIDAKFFFDYFNDKSVAYAYKLKNVKKYTKPKKLGDFGIKYAPQSFVYIK